MVSLGKSLLFLCIKLTDLSSYVRPFGAFETLFSYPANLSKTKPFHPLFCLPVSYVVILYFNAIALRSTPICLLRFLIAVALVIIFILNVCF